MSANTPRLPRPLAAKLDRAIAARPARRACRRCGGIGQPVTDHQLDHRWPVDVRHLALMHDAPIPHDRQRVADSEYLVEDVADVDDADTPILESADRLVETRDVSGREPAGRLVHEQHPGIERQRLGDLDFLLLDGRQRTDLRIEIEVDAVAIEQRLRPRGAAASMSTTPKVRVG